MCFVTFCVQCCVTVLQYTIRCALKICETSIVNKTIFNRLTVAEYFWYGFTEASTQDLWEISVEANVYLYRFTFINWVGFLFWDEYVMSMLTCIPSSYTLICLWTCSIIQWMRPWLLVVRFMENAGHCQTQMFCALNILHRKRFDEFWRFQLSSLQMFSMQLPWFEAVNLFLLM